MDQFGQVGAVLAAAPVLAADRAPSLESFGAARAISAYELSAPSLSGGAVEPAVTAALLLHMTGYIITNVAAFTAIIAYYNATGAEEIRDFRGASDRSPGAATT